MQGCLVHEEGCALAAVAVDTGKEKNIKGKCVNTYGNYTTSIIYKNTFHVTLPAS